MKPESRLKDIQIALKLADWFSTEEQGKDRGRILNIKYCAGNIGDGIIKVKGKRAT